MHFQPHCLELISASNKGSKQDQQGITHVPVLPAWRCSSSASQRPRHSKNLSSSNWPAKSTWHTHSLHKGHFYIRLLSVQQMRERNHMEKSGELQKLSRNFGNFLGSEVLVSTTVYVSLQWVGALSKYSGQLAMFP